MVIEVKFNSSELAGKLRDGAYELPEGSTVTDLMDAAQREAGFDMPDELSGNLVFLYDNRHAGPDTALFGGGKLRVLFKILGG